MNWDRMKFWKKEKPEPEVKPRGCYIRITNGLRDKRGREFTSVNITAYPGWKAQRIRTKGYYAVEVVRLKGKSKKENTNGKANLSVIIDS